MKRGDILGLGPHAFGNLVPRDVASRARQFEAWFKSPFK
jgi:hypothetical protein